ncbi:phage tail assembly chaperone [Paenibacillus sanguinis]|uniref:phage tail assembly chaperone n=1 Tax=Paenibacillus sanguinis TaxID=225906 RepID=UPI00036B7064|nr:hypothetical protein [Paenibacillus sanguinis]
MTERNMDFFMKGNAQPVEELEEVVTDRYRDKDGKAIPFVFKSVTTARIDELRTECTKRTVATKRKPATETFDNNRFATKLGIESTVFPVFKSAELLASYGLQDPVDLVQAVLAVPGEYAAWMDAVRRVNRLDDDFEEMVEDAKN